MRICVVASLPRFCTVSAYCTGWLMFTGLAVTRALVTARSVLGRITSLTDAMLLPAAAVGVNTHEPETSKPEVSSAQMRAVLPTAMTAGGPASENVSSKLTSVAGSRKLAGPLARLQITSVLGPAGCEQLTVAAVLALSSV